MVDELGHPEREAPAPPRIRWRRQASEDLEHIRRFIEPHNPGAARAMAEKIVQAANVLIAHPFFGRAGRVSGTRERVIPGTPFIIIYRAGRRLIAIERVIHGSQNWPPA